MISVAVILAGMLCSPLATAARTSPRPDPAPRAESADLAPELGTAAVTAGTYETWSLAPGATYLITAIVNISASAPKGSNIARLVTISSVGDGTKQDTVKFVAKRAK